MTCVQYNHYLQIIGASGLNVSALRFTQICGRLSSRQWSATEWLPIIVSTSIKMGALPILSGVSFLNFAILYAVLTGLLKLCPFVPLDVAAQCVHDVAFSCTTLPIVLNFPRLRPARWAFHGCHEKIRERDIWLLYSRHSIIRLGSKAESCVCLRELNDVRSESMHPGHRPLHCLNYLL